MLRAPRPLRLWGRSISRTVTPSVVPEPSSRTPSRTTPGASAATCPYSCSSCSSSSSSSPSAVTARGEIRRLHAVYGSLGPESRRLLLASVNGKLSQQPPPPSQLQPAAAPPAGTASPAEAVAAVANAATAATLRAVQLLAAELPSPGPTLASEDASTLASDPCVVLSASLPFLMDARRDFEALAVVPRTAAARDRSGSPLGALLTATLASCFRREELVVSRLVRDSPPKLLEQVVNGENVHRIDSLGDLELRLDRSRRCYGLFHRCLPAQLLAYTTVALTDRLPHSITEIFGDISRRTPEQSASTCTFYSINSIQPGLVGIDLGQGLLKQVVGIVGRELTGVREFGTLSPLPNFSKWLQWHITLAQQDTAGQEEVLTPDEKNALRTVLPSTLSFYHGLAELLEGPWHSRPDQLAVLQTPLMRLATRYLTAEKKNKAALDPVANFHLRNGATMDRLNWMADLSQQRLRESYGIMVNYRYDLAKLASNAKQYAETGTIATSWSPFGARL